MFGCISKNVLKNIFQCLVVFLKILQKTHFLLIAHIFSASKQIYNIISQQINTTKTKPNKKKKKNSTNPVKLREEGREREATGFNLEAAEARSRGGGKISWRRRLGHNGLLLLQWFARHGQREKGQISDMGGKGRKREEERNRADQQWSQSLLDQR